MALERRASLLPEETLRRAEAILRASAEEVLTEALALVPEDLGDLRASGRIEEDRTGNSVVVEVKFGGPTAPHAVFVHEGTNAPRKAPPPGVILAWVKRHFAVSNKEAKRIAYFIGRKIAREGTQPIKYLEIPSRRAIPKITARLRAVGAGKNAPIS